MDENKTVNLGWLEKTEIAVRRGETTIMEAAKIIQYDTLRNYLLKNNI